MEWSKETEKNKSIYLSVNLNQERSIGGNQAWFPEKRIRKYGCGLIAASDILHYLDTEKISYGLTKEQYTGYVHKMHAYFPILPFLGITGFGLTRGMNRYFRKQKSILRAHWGVDPEKMREKMESMLGKNIPVLLSVGPNWPALWGKQGIALFAGEKEQERKIVQKLRDHYVVVLGLDGDLLEIASWGRRYWLSFSEYEMYIRRHSCSLFSNILVIE